MSCSSPWSVSLESNVDVVTTKSTMNLQGCYTLPGYTSPSWGACTPYWVPGYPCCWYCCGNCWGGCCCTAPGWKSGYTGWYCYTVPGVELWPSLQFCGSVNLPITATASVGLDITVDSPPSPYQAFSVTLEACEIDASVNGSGFKINAIPAPTTLQQNNGEFSATTDLGGFSSSVGYAGINYSLSIDTSILFCLTPTPPLGWVNINLDCNFGANYAGIVSESVDFNISMPIVAVS